MSWTGDDVSLALWTIAVGIAASVPCAILGCYLVLRRMSLLGDAISHAVLPGVALGFLATGRLSGPGILIGAMLLGVLTAFLTQTLTRFGGVAEDTGLGIVFTALFAIGVLIITREAANVDLDPGCVLYGLIEVTPLDSWRFPGTTIEVPRALGPLLAVLAITIAFVAIGWKELMIASFDPATATAQGINATLVHYLLMGLVAVVTVAAFEAVGAILVVAMLIGPAVAGHLLSDRLLGMMIWAVVSATLASICGYSSAVVLDTSVAGMMAVSIGLIVAATVLLAPRYGTLGHIIARVELALRIASEDLLAWLYREGEPGTRGFAPGAVSLEECRWFATQGAGQLVGRLALAQLRRRGELDVDSTGRVSLSESGRSRAAALVRAHRLWESYLQARLNLPDDHVHAPAERLEHFTGPGLREELANELDRPEADPHGRAIPGG